VRGCCPAGPGTGCVRGWAADTDQRNAQDSRWQALDVRQYPALQNDRAALQGTGKLRSTPTRGSLQAGRRPARWDFARQA